MAGHSLPRLEGGRGHHLDQIAGAAPETRIDREQRTVHELRDGEIFGVVRLRPAKRSRELNCALAVLCVGGRDVDREGLQPPKGLVNRRWWDLTPIRSFDQG